MFARFRPCSLGRVTEADEVVELRESLVRGLAVALPETDPGYAAFERHQLLAIRFHRAARLNAPSEGERAGWRTYFREHFPRGDEHAVRLWEDWRCQLVKDELPGKRVAVSHGQPHGHWRIDSKGRLYLNLESMREDFEQSVDSFIAHLESCPERREQTLGMFRTHRSSVQQVEFSEASNVVMTTASAGNFFSVGSSTAWSEPDERG
jgi:hypothetical protein